MIKYLTILIATLSLLAGGMQSATAQSSDSTATFPAGLGSLKQDAIALRFMYADLEIRFTPLDEPIIRLLSPDAYQALRGLVTSQKARIDSITSRRGSLQPGIALVAFYSTSPNVRFDPRQLTVILPSRRLEPIGMIPLTPGFSSQQLEARQQVSGLVIYDHAFLGTEAFQLQYLGAMNRDWENIMTRLQSERTRIMGQINKTSSDSTY